MNEEESFSKCQFIKYFTFIIMLLQLYACCDITRATASERIYVHQTTPRRYVDTCHVLLLISVLHTYLAIYLDGGYGLCGHWLHRPTLV